MKNKTKQLTETPMAYDRLLAVVDIDRVKDFDDEDELYCNWYKCPSCESTYVRNNDNYCSNCGCKFKWLGNYS